MGHSQQTSDKQAKPPQTGKNTQSDASLSQHADAQEEDGVFGVAEEQNLDQQSTQARSVGSAPDEEVSGGANPLTPSEAMAKAARENKRPAP